MEVGILRHNRATVLEGEVPYSFVGSRLEIDIPNMKGFGKISGEFRYKTRRKIVVKQKLHAAGRVVASLRSRSAANFRHARMSSRVRSGKSLRISSPLMPEARYSSTIIARW